MRDAPFPGWHRPPRQTRRAPSLAVQVGVAAVPGLAAIWATSVLTAGTGTGLSGAVLVFLLVCMAVVLAMRDGYPHGRIGGCNRVTLLRMALVAALLVPLNAGYAGGWIVAGIAAAALILDGVDGHLARRSGLDSPFGARFDIEADAAMALVLALHVLAYRAMIPEALILGLTRYAFVLAQGPWPWLRADLPPRRWRKVVCVLQLSALIAVQVPLVGPDPAAAVARLAAGALILSFWVDLRWLWRRRP